MDPRNQQAVVPAPQYAPWPVCTYHDAVAYLYTSPYDGLQYFKCGHPDCGYVVARHNWLHLTGYPHERGPQPPGHPGHWVMRATVPAMFNMPALGAVGGAGLNVVGAAGAGVPGGLAAHARVAPVAAGPRAGGGGGLGAGVAAGVAGQAAGAGVAAHMPPPPMGRRANVPPIPEGGIAGVLEVGSRRDANGNRIRLFLADELRLEEVNRLVPLLRDLSGQVRQLARVNVRLQRERDALGREVLLLRQALNEARGGGNVEAGAGAQDHNEPGVAGNAAREGDVGGEGEGEVRGQGEPVV